MAANAPRPKANAATARAVYVPMVEERRWPAADGWLGRIRMLAAQTEQALRAYGAAQPRAGQT